MNLLRALTAFGTLFAAGWFAIAPSFSAVFFGIVSLSVLMMAFLPIPANEKI
tara:strand:- start:258384 stop:258539 length:156 start_codon:yes stop_codon:yes gene_type:complete